MKYMLKQRCFQDINFILKSMLVTSTVSSYILTFQWPHVFIATLSDTM